MRTGRRRRRPDGGELAREVKAHLEEKLGIPVGSFDVEKRLPAKDREAISNVGKLFALCPKEGMPTLFFGGGGMDI